ncbi:MULTISPECIES: BON domain-containing protein [Ramlibacter]|uniref:BON domain-containing protein n=1 Tax=Ramlibacter aquaticus TaxID=2780094 RepID=A0ABR9S9I4_9BURK|nr:MULTISPECIES: BON domain-containing protein [Ramlibacter]MBE7938996.1 BON domain-containing protein [Ramlibacter aquaticus]
MRTLALGLLLTLSCTAASAAPDAGATATGPAQAHGNLFGDPFLQATAGLPGCPPPLGPDITPEDVRREAHVRAQHGTSCFRSGRCRLPNSYLYDAEIVPRVVQFIREDGRFAGTSVWVLGERRIVTLSGCVASPAQAQALVEAVRQVDDVMNVVDLLGVGTQQPPRYPVRP